LETQATGTTLEPASHRGQRRTYVTALVRDLRVRETEWRMARSDVRLVTHPVTHLLSWSSVVPQFVRLHDEAEIRPVEVDAETVQFDLRCRPLQAGFVCDGQEDALELMATSN
jgi:hypothetical protein